MGSCGSSWYWHPPTVFFFLIPQSQFSMLTDFSFRQLRKRVVEVVCFQLLVLVWHWVGGKVILYLRKNSSRLSIILFQYDLVPFLLKTAEAGSLLSGMMDWSCDRPHQRFDRPKYENNSSLSHWLPTGPQTVYPQPGTAFDLLRKWSRAVGCGFLGR